MFRLSTFWPLNADSCSTSCFINHNRFHKLELVCQVFSLEKVEQSLKIGSWRYCGCPDLTGELETGEIADPKSIDFGLPLQAHLNSVASKNVYPISSSPSCHTHTHTHTHNTAPVQQGELPASCVWAVRCVIFWDFCAKRLVESHPH